MIINSQALGLFGVLFFSALGAWGLWKQTLFIWKERSGQSVSIVNFSFGFSYFAVGFIYSLEKNLLALTLHTVGRMLCHLPILAGLYKFKDITRNEKILSILFFLGIGITCFMPSADLSFLIYSLGSVLTYAAQPLEIFRNRNSGTVEIKLHAIYFGSSIFWTIYGFAVNDFILKTTSIPNIFISILIIALCLKYRKQIQTTT
mgnify:CR=1 FL=1